MRSNIITLSDDQAHVEIHPEVGGAVGRYDVRIGGRTQQIFQTQPDTGRTGRTGPFALGCNFLLPFSNRISGGGFWFDGAFHPLEPNFSHQTYPVHGNAFQCEWDVVELSRKATTLNLLSTGPGPFRYEAILQYTVHNGALQMVATARNTAGRALPFGIGFHPWFVRTPLTRIAMKTLGYWSEDDKHLPLRFYPRNQAGEFDFSNGAALHDGWINNAFTGWDGNASIGWPERDFGVRISAPPPLTTAIIYAPGASANYFCFEPVSHSVDAHNRSEPHTSQPQVVSPGESLVARMKITPVSP